MNTTEFYRNLAEELDVSQKDASKFSRALFHTLQDVLTSNESVSLPDLGTFDTHLREERKSYIPHYDAYMILPPKRVVDFRPAVSLKEFAEKLEQDNE